MSPSRTRWNLLLGLPLMAAATGVAAQVDESDLKSAYIFNFASFTTWPNAVIVDRPTMSICTQSQVDENLQRSLRKLQGKKVQARDVRVLSLGAVRDVGMCDIVVLGVNGLSADPALRAALAGTSVLTICDCDGGGRGGEIVRLFRDHGRLQFEIDRQAADAAGLTLSSKLLRLARGAK